MEKLNFTASLSRSQGRSSYCIIFKHPVRTGNDGKTGLRVRRGLGTSNEEEARHLVEQMNLILSDSSYWSLAQQKNAEQKFDPRITSAFYDNLKPELRDFWKIRDNYLPIPGPNDGYTRTLLIGTTGAGKTTLVRQLIGTDPYDERFPSISAAKTTFCDIEIILSDGIYRSIVTFMTRERLRQYVEECVSSAIISQFENKDVKTIERKLLEHSEQRFRLSYLLGTLNSTTGSHSENELADESESEEYADDPKEQSTEITPMEREALYQQLMNYIERIDKLSEKVFAECSNTLEFDHENANKEEVESFFEILEDEIYNNDEFHQLVDEIIEDVETRFEFINKGTVEKEREWPAFWTFETENREEFIKTINKFSSNYAPNFGRLLTPLVDGIRVSGPFYPKWYQSNFKLALMDGEGLGHTTETATSLSTSITRKYDLSDAIILVDNAAQPMQAAPLAAIRSLVSSGHESKLILCFTHFDEVNGDNLPDVESKRVHVLTSVENSLHALGKDLGKRAERAMSNALKDNIIFLSNIQKFVTEKKKFTKSELLKLVGSLFSKIQPKDVREITLFYDHANLVLSIQSALQDFHEPWRAKLGLSYRTNVRSEHWSRIKALTRRLGVLGRDEYDNLKPVADLISVLSDHIRFFINNPLRVEPITSPEDLTSEAIANIAREIFKKLHEFVPEILFVSKVSEWNRAYSHSGYGSTRVRAREIKDIYDNAAPIPGEVPSIDSNKFLSEIRALIRAGIESGGGKIV